MTRTGLSPKLSSHMPEPFVNLHPADAQKYQLSDGQLTTVASELGDITVRAIFNEQQTVGQVFCPMHWSTQFSGNAGVDQLISADLDPISGQPDFKRTAVNVSAFEHQSECYLLSPESINTDKMDYWSKQKVIGGYLYRLASALSPAELNQQLRSELMLNKSERQLCFDQVNLGRYRWASIASDKINCCLIIAKTVAQDDGSWIQNLLRFSADRDIETSVLTGNPSTKLAQGNIICACKEVGEKTITNAIKQQQIKDCRGLSDYTGAGTGCGSCLPELNNIIDAVWALS